MGNKVGRFFKRNKSQVRIALWIALAFLVCILPPLLVVSLNHIQIFGFPFGYLLTTQLVSWGLVALMWWTGHSQHIVDMPCILVEKSHSERTSRGLK